MTSTPSSGTETGAPDGVQPAADGGQPAADDLLLPTQSREDTDIGWSEPQEPDDDDRLRLDRPPHWDLT